MDPTSCAPSPASLADQALVERATPIAFAELVRRHRDRVFRRLLHWTRGDSTVAEDLTQEAFLRAFRGLSSFRGDAQFSTWIYRIALFAFLNHQKRCRYRPMSPISVESLAAPTMTNETVRFEVRKDLNLAIRGLPPRYQTILALHLHGTPYQEIADVLDLPLGTVKTQIFRAKQHLQARLPGYRGDSLYARNDGLSSRRS